MKGDWVEWDQLTDFQKEILFGQNIRVVDGKTYVFVPRMAVGIALGKCVGQMPVVEIRFKQDE
jgi:hypothetical protein